VETLEDGWGCKVKERFSKRVLYGVQDAWDGDFEAARAYRQKCTSMEGNLFTRWETKKNVMMKDDREAVEQRWRSKLGKRNS